jgi:hypothetical protein
MSEIYKLKKEYPGSPSKNSIAMEVDDEIDLSKKVYEIFNVNGESTDTYISYNDIFMYPDFWILVNPYSDKVFEKTINIKFTGNEYNSFIKILKLAIKQNITDKIYRTTGEFIENYENNNSTLFANTININIPKSFIKVLTNSIGSAVYIHSDISIEKRKELKRILLKIEKAYDYINNTETKNIILLFIEKIYKWKKH